MICLWEKIIWLKKNYILSNEILIKPFGFGFLDIKSRDILTEIFKCKLKKENLQNFCSFKTN